MHAEEVQWDKLLHFLKGINEYDVSRKLKFLPNALVGSKECVSQAEAYTKYRTCFD